MLPLRWQRQQEKASLFICSPPGRYILSQQTDTADSRNRINYHLVLNKLLSVSVGNIAFIDSPAGKIISLDEFLKDETKNRGKSHLQIMAEYKIRKLLKKGRPVEKIIQNASKEDPKLEEKLRRFAARVKGAIKRKQGGST